MEEELLSGIYSYLGNCSASNFPLDNPFSLCQQYINNMKLLPDSKKGFTLVELLVVISIISILAIVGVSVYGNAQKNARDGVRRTEISNLGKSIETAKDPIGVNYSYNATDFGVDYPQTKPKDPAASSSKPQYCVSWGLGTATAPPTDPASWGANGVCPTDPTPLTQSIWSPFVDHTSTLANAIGNRRYWKICARIEISGNPYCVTNLQ